MPHKTKGAADNLHEETVQIRRRETIEIYSRGSTIGDNININLKSGYWVKDFSIDYENYVVTLNLYEEELND